MPSDRDSGIQAVEQNENLPRSVLILRQSAAKFAGQIVAGRLAAQQEDGEITDGMVESELEKWTQKFKRAVQDGTWIHEEGDA